MAALVKRSSPFDSLPPLGSEKSAAPTCQTTAPKQRTAPAQRHRLFQMVSIAWMAKTHTLRTRACNIIRRDIRYTIYDLRALGSSNPVGIRVRLVRHGWACWIHQLQQCLIWSAAKLFP